MVRPGHPTNELDHQLTNLYKGNQQSNIGGGGGGGDGSDDKSKKVRSPEMTSGE
jgi:hypothetical protein